jgi:hypothetical protein
MKKEIGSILKITLTVKKDGIIKNFSNITIKETISCNCNGFFIPNYNDMQKFYNFIGNDFTITDKNTAIIVGKIIKWYNSSNLFLRLFPSYNKFFSCVGDVIYHTPVTLIIPFPQIEKILKTRFKKQHIHSL